MTVSVVTRRTGMYRLRTSGGALLYVGIGYEPAVRIAAHRCKPWGGDIDPTKTTIEWFDDRESAEAAELAAIRDERPIHNIVTGDDNGCAQFLPRADGKPRGRPVSPEGRRALRTIRVREAIWSEADSLSTDRGETLGPLLEAFLRRYIARHRKHDAE